MKWIKLTADNEPKVEVLCANFESDTYGYQEKIIGYVTFDEDGSTAVNDHEVLENVTHFIDLTPFDLE